MSEWRTVALEDVAADVTVGHVGPMAAQYIDSGVLFLRSQNVLPHRIDLTDVKYINEEFHRRLRKSSLRPGDVVTVRTGKPGATAVVPDNWGEANCSDLVITRPGPELSSRWLSYYINGAAEGFVASQLVGAVQQHFNVGSARAMKLTLPPLSEQRAIAEVLGALDDKIAANAKLADTADSWVRAKFDDVAQSAGRQIQIGAIVDQVRSGVDPSALEESTMYVGLEHIPRRLMWLTDSGASESVSSLKAEFERGDVLFGKLRPYFHKVVSAPFYGVCSTDVLVCRAKNGDLAGFALAALTSDGVVEWCSAASAGTRMPRTNWKDLAAAEVHWPGEAQARAMSAEVDAIQRAVEARLAESRTLASLRDTLLPQLMSGKLPVRDAEKQVEEAV